MNKVIMPETVKERAAFSIEEFAEWVGIGRTLLFLEIKEGRLVARKCGRRTIILKQEGIRWLESLQRRDNAA
jgi:hypothetical protein